MQKISVVIICKNEETEIARCLASLEGLTDDIVVFDNGSTDKTRQIVVAMGARLVEGAWEGFGKTKNKATHLAKYDWVLNLDADEALDSELRTTLAGTSLGNETFVYEMRFKNFFGNDYLKFGEWGGDKHIRLFNRNKVNWTEARVHEGLVITDDLKVLRLKGCILHYTVKSMNEYAEKVLKYAMLSAEKYAEQGKKSSLIKLYLGPVFTFIKYYIIMLGFLDGRKGFICARMTSHYTFLKYARLLELNKGL